MTVEKIPMAPILPTGLDTPALVIDIDIVERNARQMAKAASARGMALRPHVKTHKSVALARIQMAAGAVGITVGTLGEAEVMADGGIDDIILAYPLWAKGEKGARLCAMHERDDLVFTVGVDSIAGGDTLVAAVAGSSKPLRVIVELDPGYHRTGIDPAQAGALASALRERGLEVVGAFTHGGHVYRGREFLEGAAADEVRAITVGAESLRGAGFEPHILSAGSTPTALAAATPPVNEVRPGTYLINDRLQVYMGSCTPDDVAIAVAATVVSESAEGKFVIDAGAKSLTKDWPPYLTGGGFLPAYPDGVLERVTDYHGEVRIPEGTVRPRLGDVVAVVPNHVCPVIDLFSSFVATRHGEVIGRWPVNARGRSG
jgi:D-serine deaminase-like pyridoxal phosphate-dependent protein